MKEKRVNSILDVSSERSKAFSQRKLEAAEAIWESIDKLNTLNLQTEQILKPLINLAVKIEERWLYKLKVLQKT